MRATKHKLTAVVPQGPADLGAEVELEITFEYRAGRPARMYLRNGDPGYPADPSEIEVLSVKGPLTGDAYDDMRQASYNELAERYLESGTGEAAAMEVVASDDADAREYAAELRADR